MALPEDFNFLSDLISDETYKVLKENKILNETKVRDRFIIKKYKELRHQLTPSPKSTYKSKMRGAEECLEILHEDFPYIEFETVRRIAHMPRDKE